MDETLLLSDVFTDIVLEDRQTPFHNAASLYEEFTKDYHAFAKENNISPARALTTLIRNGISAQNLSENETLIKNITQDKVDITTRFSNLNEQEKSICTICTEEKKAFRSLICGHNICSACWKGHVKAQISMENILINCIGYDDGCSYCLTIEQVRLALDGDEQNFDKYKNLLLSNFIKRSPNIDNCPKCHNYVKNTAGVLNVRCECSHWFCPKCEAAPHEPVRCDLVDTLLKADNKSFKEDLDTLRYIVGQTKYCPVCETPVQKTEGCNYMRCTCNAFFCFNCLRKLNTNHESHHCVAVNGHIAQNDLEVLTKREVDVQKLEKSREKFNASNAEVKTILSNEARLEMIDEKLRRLYDSNITKEEAGLLRECFWVQVDFFSFISYASLWIDYVSDRKDLDQCFISTYKEAFAGVKKNFEDILDKVTVSREWVPKVRDTTILLKNKLSILRSYFKDSQGSSSPIS
ncbi:unnamed protein product [Auanema sp. JU1783]|nr:unnamed protein product [Auanema sp. JU1783]